MFFDDVIRRLEEAFRRELPGVAAHERLAPIPRRLWPEGFDGSAIRHAAGLLLVFPQTVNAEPAEPAEKNAVRPQSALRCNEAAAQIVLTVRSHTLGRHGGQVWLPGGVVDPGETFEQAALREAHEEIGLATGGVRVLGALTPLDIPVSGFRLHPIVAAMRSRPDLVPSDGEVARILEVPIAELLSPQSLMRTTRNRDGAAFTVPAFAVDRVEIWGATAMVIAEFLSLLGWTATQAD